MGWANRSAASTRHLSHRENGVGEDRFKVSDRVKDFPFVAELATGGTAVEVPIDLDAIAVHAAISGPALAA